jgi:curved DNA-binding protein
MARDYYDALGVSRNASADEIQQAFRRLARRYHPDVSKDPASEERFKEINEAYQVLSDPDSRRRYDRFGPDFRQVPEGYEEAAGGFRRGGPFGGARTGGSVHVGEDFGHIDFEDLFGGMFGAQQMRGADQEAEIDLSVEDAYHGGRRRITLPGTTGPRSYEVTIPPGVTDGQLIRLPEQGGHGRRGARGDLYLVVRIAAHPRYRLQGRDIYVDLPLTPWEAALGASVPVPTPGGEAKVRVPPGTSSGRRLRLRGEGMPNPDGRPGDLYAVVQVTVPTHLRQRERHLFEELAKESTFDPRKQR